MVNVFPSALDQASEAPSGFPDATNTGVPAGILTDQLLSPGSAGG
jgi:hypothetical protein